MVKNDDIIYEWSLTGSISILYMYSCWYSYVMQHDSNTPDLRVLLKPSTSRISSCCCTTSGGNALPTVERIQCNIKAEEE